MTRILHPLRHAPTLLAILRLISSTTVAAPAATPDLAARLEADAPPHLTLDSASGHARVARAGLAADLSLADGTWSLAWKAPLAIALLGVGFDATVNGASATETHPDSSLATGRDPLGDFEQFTTTWTTNGIQVVREWRFYPDHGVVTIGGRMANRSGRPATLGTVQLLQLTPPGGWRIGPTREAPAAVYIQSHSLLRSMPFPPPSSPAAPRSYRSSGVLALVARDPAAVLVVGHVRADEAAPEITAEFRPADTHQSLNVRARFLERVVDPGETVEWNRVYLAAGSDAYQALESYGDALARFSPRPVRTRPTSLWCSWYAHRMGMTEDKVLANAAVAARHLKPLGFEIMQLDHGWQRGDITGDWTPNERFPHGLKWLADQLQSRHGLRLGLWIAPTDVAETSELYRQHTEWMLRGDDGRPRVNWRWYWKPNPDCYELDVTHPDAYRFVVDTFRRLTTEGASYYKIDFIAAAGGEHFRPSDPKATRGWTNLRRAMEAIRTGAGEAAWIRYCQTPPILGPGLADSVIGGDDTLDAGIPGRFDVLRDNAHALAAGYWLNDRPYHREVCDMSVRMHGSLEEVRVRAALMTLANCSISWSDELNYLPPSRLRLMQQCLPPGNPAMRPLDLFEREVPSLWHLPVTNAVDRWDVVGVFNFEARPESRRVDFARLGLDPTTEYTVFEFWEQRFLGVLKSGVELDLPPESSRILSIRRRRSEPQLVGTDMHVLQGFHEVRALHWDAERAVLSGIYRRATGLTGHAFLWLPDGYSPRFDFPLSPTSARLTHVAGALWMQEIEFTEADHAWSIPFEKPKPPAAKEPTGN